MIAIFASAECMEQHETSQHRVLITGASKRVGRATALELARNGWDLVLTYRSSHRECDETAEEAVRAARDASHSITVRVEHLDLADLESVQRLASVVVKQGSLDAIVHNASSYRATAWGTISAADLAEFHQIEVIGPLLLTQALHNALAASTLPGGGAVVLYSDIHAIGRPRVGFAAYTIAKGAVRTLTEVLALELAPKVRVHCIAPSVVMWPTGFPQETKDLILSRTPLARVGTAEDAARLVRFLIVEASYMTGETIHLDGGRSIR